jgi:hypothetical protein
VRARSRQARLRSEYASRYPKIAVATWYPVLTAVRKVKRQLLLGDPRSSPRSSGRILNDRHFEFRGGVARDASLRTRAGDTAVWPAAVAQGHRPATSGQSLVQPEKRIQTGKGS